MSSNKDNYILNYNNKIGITCHYQTLSNILEYFGFWLPEEFVFLVMRAFYEKDAEINIPYYSNRALKNIGFSIDTYYFKDKEEFDEIIKNSINYYIPVIVNANGKSLPYFPADDYLYNFKSHIITICGINNNKVYISDCYVPYYPLEIFNGWIEKNSIINSISQSNNPNKLFIIKRIEKKSADAVKIFNLCICKVLDELVEENNRRIEIIESKDLRELNFPKNKISNIAKLNRLELLCNGGPVETRKFMSYAFDYLSGLDKKYNIIYEKFKEYMERWTSIANVNIRFSVTKDMELFKRNVINSYKLAKEEITFMEKVKKELNINKK